MNKPHKRNRVKGWHKWLGLTVSFFALLFAVSGIFLNHRSFISNIDISRDYLPDYLKTENWNQNSIKTTLNIGGDSILMYGASGIWLTDQRHSFVERFEGGMKKGVDNRNTTKIVKTKDGNVFAVTTYDLYHLNEKTKIWHNISSLIDSHERLCDAAINGDTLVVISRSNIFTSIYPFDDFSKSSLSAPSNYENKVSLFKTIWRLHSGELFGEVGKIIVDLLGVATIIFSITGIIIFLFPKVVRKFKRKGKNSSLFIAFLRPSYKWHRKLGYWLTPLILILFISGTFLRPPLLISIIRSTVAPLPFTTLDSENAWNDKLRCINYDTVQNEWLLYTSEGFYSMKDLDSSPQRIMSSPRVSVMGVNIMQQVYHDCWIVGSFDGLVLWDRKNGVCIDYLTKRPIMAKRFGPPQQQVAVTGYSADFLAGDIAFGYSFGAKYIHRNGQFISMPKYEKSGMISLWHLALEVHTGRIYQPIIGFFSDFFVFISGTLLVLITITGFMLYIKKTRYKQKHK